MLIHYSDNDSLVLMYLKSEYVIHLLSTSISGEKYIFKTSIEDFSQG